MIWIRYILHIPKKTTTFKAYRNKKAIGYLKYKFADDASAKNGKRNVEISYVFVQKAFRRKGVATQLITQFLDSLQGIVWVSLWTGRQAEMDKSYSLYKKNGFVQKTIMHDYYEDGVPTRLFVKRLE